jgi:hypothetical protein
MTHELRIVDTSGRHVPTGGKCDRLVTSYGKHLR